MKTPAEIVISKCGGVDAVRQMLGISISRVYRWTYPRERGGTGGHVPAKHQPILLEKARLAGRELVPDDFFPSSPEARS